MKRKSFTPKQWLGVDLELSHELEEFHQWQTLLMVDIQHDLDSIEERRQELAEKVRISEREKHIAVNGAKLTVYQPKEDMKQAKILYIEKFGKLPTKTFHHPETTIIQPAWDEEIIDQTLLIKGLGDEMPMKPGSLKLEYIPSKIKIQHSSSPQSPKIRKKKTSKKKSLERFV